MEPFSFGSTFGFNLDLSFWDWVFAQPPNTVSSYVVAIFGWVILALIFFWMGTELWLKFRRGKACSKWQWALLAVDIPPLYIQTPKAVEQIFAHLSGAKISNNIMQKFWQGRWQKWFSIEIISIEGYIQFLIRTEAEFRDLVEAAIYAQYAEAEITEVEDYVDFIPNRYPNDTHDVFGVEFKLASPNPYPIRTYPSFEYNISKDLVFSDPMAAILENFSRIGRGENVWFQIILRPAGNDWKEDGIALVKQIVSGRTEGKAGFWGKLGGLPKDIAQELIKIWYWDFTPAEKPEEKPPGKVMDLTPGVKNTVESIEDKISKIGFHCKMRLLYAARKEVFFPNRCVEGFVGAINQFHVMSRNAIVLRCITKTNSYVLTDYLTNLLKSRFTRAFQKRLLKPGGVPCILNIEELATLWHFPLPFVKTPLVQKAGAKRGEPPMNLPIETSESPLRPKTVAPKAEAPAPAAEPSAPEPEELPYG